MSTWTRLPEQNLLEQRWASLRQQARKALVAFVPAGDPHLTATRDVLDTLLACGADVLEVGFPYSDPIADGPLIQASYHRALSSGVRVQAILEMLADWLSAQRTSAPRQSHSASQAGARQAAGVTPNPCHQATQSSTPGVPVVAMVSYSLVYRQGERRFIERCARAGLSGLVVPDLPAEEGSSLGALCREHELALIQLVAPTTPPQRVRQIVAQCTGFVYCVSVTGITGVREQLPADLRERLVQLRQLTDLPICVGFGISRPEHAQMLRPYADGIIVGSALVARLAEANQRPWAEVVAGIGEVVRQLRHALDTPAASVATK